MRIAVIIVTYNSAKWIGQCFESVHQSAYPDFGVIVVDNASLDDSADLVARYPAAELIRLSENKGFGAGNNAGITRALEKGYDAVVLLNPDTKVEPDWLRHLAEAAQDPKVGIVQSLLLLGNEPELVNTAGNALHCLGFGFVKNYRASADKYLHRAPFEVAYTSGAAMLIKREVLDVAGLFDEKLFMYNDDQDLGWRARLAGYKIVVAPKSIVCHFYEWSRNKKKFYWNERNRWVLLLQNYSSRTLFLLSPMLVVIEVAMLSYSFMGGWFLMKIESYIWLARNFAFIMRDRQKVQNARKVSDRAIMKHMDTKLAMAEVDSPILRYLVSPMVQLYAWLVRPLI